MADGMSVAFEGWEDLTARLNRVGLAVDFVCRIVALDTAKKITAEARERVKHLTGTTESGIHWELTHDGLGYVVLAYQSGVQAPVDEYLEFGTEFMRKQPFFIAAALLEEGPHMERLSAAINDALEELGR